MVKNGGKERKMKCEADNVMSYYFSHPDGSIAELYSLSDAVIKRWLFPQFMGIVVNVSFVA
jgi:hypothetical protein